VLDGTWTALQVAKFVLWNFLRQTSMAARRPTVWNWNLHFGLPHFFLFTDSCLNKRGEYCTNLACGTHGLPGRILDGAIGICHALTLGLVHLGSSCYRLAFSVKASAMSGLSTCHDEGSGVAVLWAVFSEVHSSPAEVTDFWERIARCFFFSSKILPLIHRSCAVLLV
jgi:hypothetical protein